jgi:uncharacterized protein YwqG
LIQNYVAASRTRTLALRCLPAAQVDAAEPYHASLGGAPLLPENFDWPKDKSGVPMLFIAQFDLGRLPTIDVNWPKQGLLSIFRSGQILTMPVKDHRFFHISFLTDFAYDDLKSQFRPLQFPGWVAIAAPCWSVNEQLDDLRMRGNLSSDVVEKLQTWCRKYNHFYCGNNQIFPADTRGLAEQKEICAFAAGGITHSPTRAADRHYSHLIDDAPNWLLLAKIDEAGLFGHSGSGSDTAVSQTRLFIRRQDLAQGLLNQARIICLGTAGGA